MSEQTNVHIAYCHYAHCVKWTEGELDRDPFTKYELRECPVVVTQRWSDTCDGWEWEVATIDGKVLACEDELEAAMGLAQYELMKTSQEFAPGGKTSAFLGKMETWPKTDGLKGEGETA